MQTLTLCLIARDEAAFLGDCLASVVDVVDEIIVVDTGSVDETVRVARSFGAKVTHFVWIDDFSAARNAAVKEATTPWILVLDADERLASGAGAEIAKAIGMDALDCGMLPLHNANTLDAAVDDVVSGAARLQDPCLLPRLFRRTADLRWEGTLHESPRSWMNKPGRRIGRVEAPIAHYGCVPQIVRDRRKHERNVRLLELQCGSDPTDSFSRAFLARELVVLGDGEKARIQAEIAWDCIVAARLAGETNNTVVPIATLRGHFLMVDGDLTGCIEVIDKVRAWGIYHPNLDLLDGVCHEQLARQKSGQDRVDALARASVALQDALSVHGQVFAQQVTPGATSWVSANVLGAVLLQQGRPSAAAAVFQRVLDSRPGELRAVIGLGEAFLDQGEPASALQQLEPTLQGEIPDGWLLAAAACKALGADADAELFLDRVNTLIASGGKVDGHLEARLAELNRSSVSEEAPVARFQISVIDPDSYRYGHFLHDIIKILCHAIETLGYDCVINRNAIASDRINIIIGAHLLTDPAFVQNLVSQGVDYVVYQTEVIRPDGINTSGDSERLHKVYLPLLRGARAVWDVLVDNIGPLLDLGIVSRFLQPGYHPCLEEIVHKRNKDIDMLFFGSITAHRREVFNQLIARGNRLHTAFDPVAIYRNDLISRAKIHVVPGQGGGMNQLPYWRIIYLLHNGCVPVVERCVDQEWLEHCFLWADSDSFIELCEATAARDDLEELAAELQKRMKRIRMTAGLAPLIDNLLGREGAVKVSA